MIDGLFSFLFPRFSILHGEMEFLADEEFCGLTSSYRMLALISRKYRLVDVAFG